VFEHLQVEKIWWVLAYFSTTERKTACCDVIVQLILSIFQRFLELFHKYTRKMYLVNVIIYLLLSNKVWPKVITLSIASYIADFEYHEVAFAWWFDSRVMLRSICVAIFPAVKSFPCQSRQISWRMRALWCSPCIPSKSFSKSSKTFFFLTWLAPRPNDCTGNDFKGKAF